eukprot:PhM_4_TR4124/c0_g1_i1/m.18321/K00655/plsC; 1-acyl-sn-glycerol-3-phosphate acyltransferase
MCCIFTLGFSAVAIYVMAQVGARLCPKVWFGITAFVCIGTISVLSLIADNMCRLGVAKETTMGICNALCGWFWWLWLLLNPQIKLEEKGSSVKWADVPRGSVVLVNHMSFLDAIIATSRMPHNVVWYAKSMYKSSLSKLPLMGPLFARCGHFPVYFKGTDLGDYSVDKDLQTKVNDDAEKFVSKKEGYLVMCPEGAMNPEPFRLLPFRHGSFALATKHKAPIYGFVLVGCADAWPRGASVGGSPSHIKYRLVKMDINYEDPEMTYGAVADQCRLQMQKQLDGLLKA